MNKMPVIIHLCIILCCVFLIPTDPSLYDILLVILIQVLVLIFNMMTFKQGMVIGRQVVWQALADTMHEKNIKSIHIQKTDHD